MFYFSYDIIYVCFTFHMILYMYVCHTVLKLRFSKQVLVHDNAKSQN